MSHGLPPDKSVGARPSVQEKTAGTGNCGMSPRGGTNVDDQSLKVPVNLREQSLYSLYSLFEKGLRIHFSEYDAYYKALTDRGTAIKACSKVWSTEVDSNEHQEAVMQAVVITRHNTLTVIESMLMLMAVADELESVDNPPWDNPTMKSTVKLLLDKLMGSLQSDPINYDWTRTVVLYQKLLIKSEDMKDIPPVKPVKPAPRLSFGGLTVIRWKDQTIGGQTIPEDTFSFGGALPGTKVIHVPPVKPVPSFSFGGQTKEAADERGVYDVEKAKDVEEEAAAIKRAEKKKAKRIRRQAASEEIAGGKADAKQAEDKEAAKKKIAAEKAAIDNDEADKKMKTAEKVAVRQKEATEQALAERIAVAKADADARKKAEDELDSEMRAMEKKANDGKRAVKGRGRGPLKGNQADVGKRDKARLNVIKEKIEMEKKRQVDEDKVRQRATERDANRNGRSDMFMNSLRILQERRLADRTVMKRLEVQRREEEEAQINRDLAYERTRIQWVESIWNQVEKKKAKAMRRCEKEETRRNVQSELFHVQWKKESDKWRSQWDLWMVQLGGVPATLIGLERAVRYNGKPCIILKQLQDTEDRYQVKLENGRMLSVEAKNVRTDRAIPIRGAIGRKEGMMNKEKAMQKKQRRQINRIKKALVYWKKRPLIQGTSSPSKQSRQIRPSTRVLHVRTFDLKRRSTRRGKMKLSTVVAKRASKKGQNIRSSTRRMKDKNEEKDWWKTQINSNRNWKRKSLKGSTDVYLLKRTIELEID